MSEMRERLLKAIEREIEPHASYGVRADGKLSYASDGDIVPADIADAYFSIFKRGMRGVYQHCAKKHLHRYLAEFDFRYSNRIALGIDDTMRATTALQGVVGKRLTYRQPSEA